MRDFIFALIAIFVFGFFVVWMLLVASVPVSAYVVQDNTGVLNTTRTKLLLTTGSGTSFSDTSAGGINKTISRFGDTMWTSVSLNFGKNTIYFDGTGDYLTANVSSDFNFSSNDWTVDAFVNVKACSPFCSIYEVGNGDLYLTGGFYMAFYIQTGGTNYMNMRIENSNGNGFGLDYQQPITMSMGTFYHYAFVYNNGVFSFYQNGVSQYSSAISSPKFPTGINRIIVGALDTPLYDNTGYISNLRVTNGLALWKKNFNPPNRFSDQ